MEPAAPQGSLQDRGYARGDYLGKGSFGTSFRVHRTPSGDMEERLMVKQISLRQLSDKHLRQTFKEVEILQACHHPNIVRYADSFVDADRLLNIVMEFCPAGDLTSRVGKVDEELFWNYLIQLTQGLKYLHDRRILHRDIKPANLLLTDNGTVKIADMGLGRVLSPDTQFAETFCGSPLYLAPELHAEECRYDASCDVWALGCTLHELLAGTHPFHARSMAEMLRKIAAADPPALPAALSPETRFLVGRMLQKAAPARPGCDDVLLFEPVRRRLEVVLVRRLQRAAEAQLLAAEAAHEERVRELSAKAERTQQRLAKYQAKARAHAEDKAAAAAAAAAAAT